MKNESSFTFALSFGKIIANL